MNDVAIKFTNDLKEKLLKKGGRAPKDVALLLDTSGSMLGEPLFELSKVASQFKWTRRLIFNSIVTELMPWENIGNATGSTRMDLAFKVARGKGIRHVVLVTDGEPDSEEMALHESVGLKIDIIYIGPEPAPEFLSKLANYTGGTYGEASLSKLKELETKITALLPAPGDSPINL